MATTTNYGWTTPDDTALVKDGAAAIRSLGTAIDTSMNTALGTKKAGLVLLNTTTFSAVTAQSVSSCFNTTYDNYRIIVDLTAVTADADVYLRLRTGSTDVTSNYQLALRGLKNDGTSEDYGSTGLGYFFIGSCDAGNNNHSYCASVDLSYPFLAQRTLLNLVSSSITTTGAFRGMAGGSMNINATSYESITVGATSGNITGTISIYGYNK